MRPFAFGVDIGGTAVKLGLFQTSGALLEKWEIPTRTEENGRFLLPDVLRAMEGALERHSIDWSQTEGAGMGVPGPVREDGTVDCCINLGWGVFNVPEAMRALEPRIQRVRAVNDGNAAALGELWKGAAQGRRSIFMATLGTGVGGGLVLDEKIVNGSSGSAGEIGHFCVNFNEPEPCSCGLRGCLEQYCSARGLLRCARLALSEQPDRPTALRETENLTAKSICDAARAGDALALELLDQLGERLGWALTAIAGSVNPQAFVIGGGLSNAGSILLERIQAAYRKHAFHAFRDTEFLPARLGNDAGIYGCVRTLL